MHKLECNIEEIHHISKVDAPSGTAIEIKNLIKKYDLLKIFYLLILTQKE